MLNRPIVIKVLELTREDVEAKQQALDLGLPMPEVFGKETDAYFYSIDVLLAHPEAPDMTVIISKGEEFATYATIEDIVAAIKEAQK